MVSSSDNRQRSIWAEWAVLALQPGRQAQERLQPWVHPARDPGYSLCGRTSLRRQPQPCPRSGNLLAQNPEGLGFAFSHRSCRSLLEVRDQQGRKRPACCLLPWGARAVLSQRKLALAMEWCWSSLPSGFWGSAWSSWESSSWSTEAPEGLFPG